MLMTGNEAEQTFIDDPDDGSYGVTMICLSDSRSLGPPKSHSNDTQRRLKDELEFQHMYGIYIYIRN